MMESATVTPLTMATNEVMEACIAAIYGRMLDVQLFELLIAERSKSRLVCGAGRKAMRCGWVVNWIPVTPIVSRLFTVILTAILAVLITLTVILHKGIAKGFVLQQPRLLAQLLLHHFLQLLQLLLSLTLVINTVIFIN